MAESTMSDRIPLILGVTVPPVLAAVIGFTHPMSLNPDTADYWRDMHIALLFVFPLFGFAPWVIARRIDRRVGWVAAVAGFGFSTMYTALDVLAGIAGGQLVASGEPDARSVVNAVARPLAQAGVWSLVIAALIVGVAVIVRSRREWTGLVLAMVGTVLAAVGAWLIYDGHIYVPKGTTALLLTAAGFGLLAFAATRSPATPPEA